MPYYAIPFATEQPAGRAFRQVSAEESVRQHIQLLLTTMPGSFRFAPLYGSVLNKHHFQLPDKRKGEKKLEAELKERLQQNLRLLLARYEPRLVLQDLEVTVRLPQPDSSQSSQLANRITFDVNLIGTVNGRDTFEHTASLHLK